MVQSLGLIGFLTVILWAPLLTLEDKPDNWNQDGWITAFKIHSGYENGTTNWYWYYHNNENACVENGVTSEHVCEAMKQACLTNTILNFFLIISFVMSICALCWSIWQLKGYMHRMCVSTKSFLSLTRAVQMSVTEPLFAALRTHQCH